MLWSAPVRRSSDRLRLGKTQKSVVIEEVPPNCTVVGVPGHIVKQNDVRIPRKSMDHIHLPDPIFEDIKVLQQENTELTNRVLELEGELRQMRKKERTEQK